MHIDVTQHIGNINREVTTREHDGKPARVAVISRVYNTTPQDLWDAVTKAERIPRWFAPVSGDLRLGGRYQITGNAGGEILVCEPPRHFRITWEYGGATSWVEVRIAKHGAGAMLTLEHTAYEDKHWQEFGPGATGVGWDLALVGLTQHLDTGASASAEAGMAWMMSENGKSFMRESSVAWCRANIAAGADRAAAEAAAARTTAAYTGA